MSSAITDGVHIEDRDSAFGNHLQSFSIVNEVHVELKQFFECAYELFRIKIFSVLHEFFIIKITSCLVCNFSKQIFTDDGELTETQKVYLNTCSEIVDIETELRSFYDEFMMERLIQKVDDIELRGSGFSLSEIIELNIQISHFDPCSGSTYLPLPIFLKTKRAIVNVQNDDEQCFKYAVLSAIYPVKKNPQRVTNYLKYAHTLDFSGLRYPVDLKQIQTFEIKNPSISINVYFFDNKNEKVRPLRLTKEVKDQHIHLLLLTDMSEDNEEPVQKSHYCWIKNLSGLISTQISTHKGKLHFCDRCLNHFSSAEKLGTHSLDCLNQNQYEIEMPTFNSNILEFSNFKNQLKVPFVIYADVESILKKPESVFSKSDSTIAYQHHEVHSVGYYLKYLYTDSKSFYRSRRGVDCMRWFIQELNEIIKRVDIILHKPKPIQMTLEDEVLFIWSDDCHICGEKFVEGKIKVRDHSHITGEFRGAAHKKCNLEYQESDYIPVIFHNLSHYDAHFVIKELARNMPGRISVIPCNDQQYISFSKIVPSSISTDKVNHRNIKLRFIDSFRFMNSSLDFLSSMIPLSEKKILQSECKEYSEEQIQLLSRKGVFCYDYIDSYEKLNETSLPPKEEFYNALTESSISDNDYEFANKVWNTFNLKTIGEYSDLYMKTDILLLADVFENFRNTCYKIYKLDPAHYFTAPGLSFDAMLKYTEVKIELFTDIDMLLFIERGIRGGISQCSKRYSKANNKYMNDFDQTKDNKYLMYLDANNLYGYSMMQHLPIDNFVWCDETFSTDQILNIPDDSSNGYIFEVDLKYPLNLHELHKDYPFCAENRLVPHTKNDKKLLLTLFDKHKYVIHYKMLKRVLRHGLRLQKIHKVLKFRQTPWLKPYIDLNTSLRTQAKNEFEKNFYKLLINAIYGKTMENLRSRVDIRLKTSWDGRYGAAKMIALPNFKRFNIFDKHLVAIELTRTHILMNKPIIVGMSILDISKDLMYEFYYDFIKPKYQKNVEMLYTDTDSLILEITTDNFYNDMLQSLSRYDTSDYPQPNIFNIPCLNKKVPGLFKDELNGLIMTEFVGLRAKMYCVKADGVEVMKKAKGVKKYVLKKSITFEHYMRCISDNSTVISCEQNSIRSKNHNVYSIRQTKIALSPMDNKRYIFNTRVDTLPWGHYRIPLQIEPDLNHQKLNKLSLTLEVIPPKLKRTENENANGTKPTHSTNHK